MHVFYLHTLSEFSFIALTVGRAIHAAAGRVSPRIWKTERREPSAQLLLVESVILLYRYRYLGLGRMS